MNEILKGYIIFCVVLISIVAIFALYFENPPMRIVADGEHAKIIREALEKTDKNATSHITSITVVNDLNLLSRMGCMKLDKTVWGCAATSYNKSNMNSFEVEIYLPSRELLKGTCGTFENTLYHEIGHVVYFQKYGNAGTYQIDQEPYAVSYANQFAKDKCKR
ncbi:MAG: hypothetical protein PHU34_09230 [Candidatus Methanoperedens sp.]|nr:hypothetical protein [Candidatus Methanoperedens sp.]